MKTRILLTSIFIVIVAATVLHAQTWSARQSGGDYVIGAGDILDITTWKEVDLTRTEVLVRLDGKILPSVAQRRPGRWRDDREPQENH